MAASVIQGTRDPIAAVLDFDGAAAADYDRLNDRIGSCSRQRRLQGCVYHWMRLYGDGFRVIEFWRGRELFDRFIAEEFQPALRELGLDDPRVTVEALPADTFDQAESSGSDPGE